MASAEWNTYASTRDAVRVEDGSGRIVVAAVVPGVQVATIWGHFTPTLSRAIVVHASEQLTAAPFLTAFHNWTEMTGYETACREQLTRWAMRHRHDSKLHLLLRSPIVAMGVTVANLALGNVLVVHRSLSSLRGELQSELARRSG